MSEDVVIWHNPRCSKSRETLKLLQENGVAPRIVEYLKETPKASEIKDVLSRLEMAPRDLMRKKEAPYKELGLADETMSDAALIEAMHAHPILIERPVVLKGAAARLGRPPETVLELLES